MTTNKRRITVWLRSSSEVDALFDELRRRAPIEARGAISRSTAIEAAVSVALRDLQARGRDSDVYRTVVTLPAILEAQP